MQLIVKKRRRRRSLDARIATLETWNSSPSAAADRYISPEQASSAVEVVRGGRWRQLFVALRVVGKKRNRTARPWHWMWFYYCCFSVSFLSRFRRKSRLNRTIHTLCGCNIELMDGRSRFAFFDSLGFSFKQKFPLSIDKNKRKERIEFRGQFVYLSTWVGDYVVGMWLLVF